MAYKKDTRQRVRVLRAEPKYLENMVGRVESQNGDYYEVMIGPSVISIHKNDLEILN